MALDSAENHSRVTPPLSMPCSPRKATCAANGRRGRGAARVRLGRQLEGGCGGVWQGALGQSVHGQGVLGQGVGGGGGAGRSEGEQVELAGQV